jgi:hypothetical protein
MSFFNNVLFSISLSLLIHALFLYIVSNITDQNSTNNHNKKNNQITIKRFERRKTKLKTVGNINGIKKDSFSMPIKPTNKIQKKQHKLTKFVPSTKSINKLIKKIERNNLTIKQNKKRNSNGKIAPVSKYEVISYNAVSQDTQEALQITDFSMNIPTPKGIEKSKLNAAEKIFYSFYKRTYSRYVHSYISSRNKIMTNKPYLKNKKIVSRHVMSAKVTYDKNGNVFSINTVRWANDDDLQNLFQKTVEGIKNIPNPPSDLIDENNNFVIHYELYFNLPKRR